uniref:MAP7 domain containing 2 n=1 Tax=Myotis myotis TaxID=51298 RepID=A0A7J7YEK3_MYOMY|nr:MAP7 domain containing 2 [Myotis myotis]
MQSYCQRIPTVSKECEGAISGVSCAEPLSHLFRPGNTQEESRQREEQQGTGRGPGSAGSWLTQGGSLREAPGGEACLREERGCRREGREQRSLREAYCRYHQCRRGRKDPGRKETPGPAAEGTEGTGEAGKDGARQAGERGTGKKGRGGKTSPRRGSP